MHNEFAAFYGAVMLLGYEATDSQNIIEGKNHRWVTSFATDSQIIFERAKPQRGEFGRHRFRLKLKGKILKAFCFWICIVETDNQIKIERKSREYL